MVFALGVGIGPLYIIVFFFFFFFFFLIFIILPVMLYIILILDLVTHCCVCLVFVKGMGGRRDGWNGFCFLPFGMVWRHFLFKHFWPSDSHFMKSLCMVYGI